MADARESHILVLLERWYEVCQVINVRSLCSSIFFEVAKLEIPVV